VLPGTIGNARAAEHPRQFIHSRIAFERLECGPRRASIRALPDPDLPVGLRGDLGQVRHAQDLA
jgi:hypothetical protein